MDAYAKPPLQGKLAFQQGAIFGVGIAIISIVVSFLGRYAPIGWLSWIVDIVGYLIVGMLTTQKTVRVATGTMAGLWAGLIGGAITFIWSILSAFVFFPTDIQQSLQQAASQAHTSVQTLQAAASIGIVVMGILGLAASLGIGAGFGAIGGVIGKSRVKTPPAAEYQDASYPTSTPQ